MGKYNLVIIILRTLGLIHRNNTLSTLTVITWPLEMGSHVNYSVKGIDISIPFNGFPFSTSSAPSWDVHRGFRRGYRM